MAQRNFSGKHAAYDVDSDEGDAADSPHGGAAAPAAKARRSETGSDASDDTFLHEGAQWAAELARRATNSWSRELRLKRFLQIAGASEERWIRELVAEERPSGHDFEEILLFAIEEAPAGVFLPFKVRSRVDWNSESPVPPLRARQDGARHLYPGVLYLCPRNDIGIDMFVFNGDEVHAVQVKHHVNKYYVKQSDVDGFNTWITEWRRDYSGRGFKCFKYVWGTNGCGIVADLRVRNVAVWSCDDSDLAAHLHAAVAPLFRTRYASRMGIWQRVFEACIATVRRHEWEFELCEGARTVIMRDRHGKPPLLIAAADLVLLRDPRRFGPYTMRQPSPTVLERWLSRCFDGRVAHRRFDVAADLLGRHDVCIQLALVLLAIDGPVEIPLAGPPSMLVTWSTHEHVDAADDEGHGTLAIKCLTDPAQHRIVFRNVVDAVCTRGASVRIRRQLPTAHPLLRGPMPLFIRTAPVHFTLINGLIVEARVPLPHNQGAIDAAAAQLARTIGLNVVRTRSFAPR